MSLDVAREAMGTWVEEALQPLGWTVIDHDQPRSGDSTTSPSPPLPFASVMVTPVRRVGDRDSWAMNGEVMEHKGERIATLTITLYGETSDEAVDVIRSKLMDYHQPTLFNAGVSYQRELGSIDSTAFMSTRHDKRAQLTLQFSYGVSYQTSPGVIETVTFDGELVSNPDEPSRIILDIDLT